MDLHLPAPYAARLVRDEPLARHTAARLGGPADLAYPARESVDELAAVVSAAWAQGVPLRVLGGGSNVLVSDAGFRGLVVVNHVADAAFNGTMVDVASGHALTVLARRCAARGLSGFEWAASVPGTVGGAVVNNAGAHGGDMAGSVVAVELLTDDGRRTLERDALGYGYRTSVLKAGGLGRFLVLRARLAFTPDAPEGIARRMDDYIAHRKRTQPPGASLGSIFKNPPGDYAGRLIEHCGLKGLRIGGAEVSPLHANFFINTGSATAADYAALIGRVRDTVAQATGVLLEPEVELLGFDVG